MQKIIKLTYTCADAYTHMNMEYLRYFAGGRPIVNAL